MTWSHVFVLLVATFLELIWAGWTLAVAKQKPMIAAVTSILMVYVGTFLLQQWLDDPAVLHWTAAGHGIGSYVLLKVSILHENSGKKP